MDESQEKEEQQTSEPIIQPIIDLGSSLIQTDKGTIYVLTIVGTDRGPPDAAPQQQEYEVRACSPSCWPQWRRAPR